MKATINTAAIINTNKPLSPASVIIIIYTNIANKNKLATF